MRCDTLKSLRHGTRQMLPGSSCFVDGLLPREAVLLRSRAPQTRELPRDETTLRENCQFSFSLWIHWLLLTASLLTTPVVKATPRIGKLRFWSAVVSISHHHSRSGEPVKDSPLLMTTCRSVPLAGFEPAADGLENHCSSVELQGHTYSVDGEDLFRFPPSPPTGARFCALNIRACET